MACATEWGIATAPAGLRNDGIISSHSEARRAVGIRTPIAQGITDCHGLRPRNDRGAGDRPTGVGEKHAGDSLRFSLSVFSSLCHKHSPFFIVNLYGFLWIRCCKMLSGSAIIAIQWLIV